MSKVIRVTAILAVLLDMIYFLLGRLAAPVLGLLLYSGSFDIFDGSTSMTYSLILFAVTTILSFAYTIAFMGYCIFMAVTAKSSSENIAMEISGFIIFGILGPLVSSISPLINVFINLLNAPPATFAITSTTRTYSSLFFVLHLVALGLAFIAFSFSICRKKYASIVVFEDDKEVDDNL